MAGLFSFTLPGRRAAMALGAAVVIVAAGVAGAEAAPDPRLKPPAPGPSYMSRLDHARLTGITKALEQKAFSQARADIARVEDPTARSLAQWLYWMAKDPDMDLVEADAFLDAHPDWPATGRIQSFVESRISDGYAPATIRAFFDGRAPATGDGKAHLARSLLAAGDSDAATALIRDAWINHNFTVSEERKFLNAHKARLQPSDHAARVDRLLWARQVTNARRVFPYLESADRRMAEARAALLLRAATGPKLYRALPSNARLDSGVLHAAVRYYRRTEDQDAAIKLAAKAPTATDAVRNPGRWWTERRILAQWALKEGRPVDAYGLAAQHGASEGTDFSDAEFYAGWIALRFLNDAARAKVHFEAMTGAVATPISLSRGYYWMGRADEAAGDAAAAQENYRAAARHYYSFYGQLAAEKLGGDAVARSFAPAASPNADDTARFNARPAVAAMRMLSDLGRDYEFMVFAYHVDDQLERPGEFEAFAQLTAREGAPHLTVRAGKVAARRGAFAPQVSYPTVFVPDEARAFVSPEIILGLSRQESEFNPRAYSSAGARGVMQLIPSTAQITARKEGLPYRRSALLDDPVYNMTLGSAHLSHLLDRFDGSLIMTLAAYNAGAHRATRWAEDYGDPRTGDVDPLDWIELIPFSETRNYVQRVLENVQVYRGRLNNAAIPGRLARDIERGGPSGRVARNGPPSLRLAALGQTRSAAGALIAIPDHTIERATRFRLARAESAGPANAPSLAPAPTSGELVTPAPIAAAPSTAPSAKTDNITQQPTAQSRMTPSPMTMPSSDTAEQSRAAPSQKPRGAAPADATPDAPPAMRSNASVPDGAAAQTPRPEAPVEPSPPADPAPQTVAPSAPVVAQTPPPGRAAPAGLDKEARAAAMIEKAADRLNISGDEDALAAAIVRGLEQLEGSATADPDDPCATPEGDEDAADLNARMMAQLRGEDVTCAAE